MGSVLRIPEVNKPSRTEILINPENDVYYLIKEYMGDEVAAIYESMFDELKDYREREDE